MIKLRFGLFEQKLSTTQNWVGTAGTGEPKLEKNRNIFMIILLIFFNICILYRTFRMPSFTLFQAGKIDQKRACGRQSRD